MSFFDQFQRGVDVAKFKANQLSRINKLQNDMANLAGEIQNARKQIADTTIQLSTSGIELPPQLKEFCKKISQLENDISSLEQTITNIRAETYNPTTQIDPMPTPEGNLIKCPQCTQDVPDDADFCIHCGKKIK